MSDVIVIVDQVSSVAQIVEQVTEVVQIVERGMQGPPGDAGGGLTAVVEDLSPELGGDLVLNSFDILGQLDNPTLTLDGGLL